MVPSGSSLQDGVPRVQGQRLLPSGSCQHLCSCSQIRPASPLPGCRSPLSERHGNVHRKLPHAPDVGTSLVAEPALPPHVMTQLRGGAEDSVGTGLRQRPLPQQPQCPPEEPTQHVELRPWTATQDAAEGDAASTLPVFVASEGPVRTPGQLCPGDSPVYLTRTGKPHVSVRKLADVRSPTGQFSSRAAAVLVTCLGLPTLGNS